MAFEIKQHDTSPAYVYDMQDGVDGESPTAIDLTDATGVVFKMRLADTTGAPQVEGAMEITTAASGRVTYEWEAGDTDTVGTYDVEYEITWTDGTTETVPNNSYDSVIVYDDLDD
jgi:hypothetical protein